MQSKAVTIRVQQLDGTWATIGGGDVRGVYPENDSYTADEFGSSKCSFDLHRDPGAIFPDIMAFTPIEVEIGGVKIWSGRVSETPVREGDRIYNVQGAGWQYHLDDDVYDHKYVVASLADFKDIRSLPGTDLSVHRQYGQVQNDRGVITLGIPSGTVVPVNTGFAVQLDLGAGNGATTLAMNVASSGNASATYIYMIGSDISDWTVASSGRADYAVAVVNNGFTIANLGGTGASGAKRYVTLLMYTQGVGYTAGSDVWFRINSIVLAADPAYLPALASTLKATQIIPDALNRATILLSSDRSQIDPNGTVTFAFPEFAMDGQRTPREVLNACNAVHDYTLKVDVDKRVVFLPKTASPRVEIGAWPGAEFDDASANSGDEIYNRVVVEGTGPDGTQLSVERSQAQQAGATFEVISSPAPGNPSFAVDASTWTPSSPTTMVRTTTAGLFASAPGGGVWGNLSSGLGDTLTETFTGTFQAGITYLLTLQIDYQAPTQGVPTLDVAFGSGADAGRARWTPSGFATQYLAWTPNATYPSGVTLKFTTVIGHPGTWLIDSLALSISRPTLVDRRGFRRTGILPISNSLTPALGTQIGDVWLKAHKTTPLKGTVKITGDRAARDIMTGASVPPERLLTMTGDLLRLSHRIDPDTGGSGRDGRIAEVTYVPKDDAATVSIDSRRTSQEALLARMAIVIGSG